MQSDSEGSTTNVEFCGASGIVGLLEAAQQARAEETHFSPTAWRSILGGRASTNLSLG